jgi:pimeloyl-ACP methyl ester carboxylesterase
MTTTHPSRIFLHGLESSSRGTKAMFLRSIFPDILTPDFSGTLEERMRSLEPFLVRSDQWVMVGSSFGGLMAALWTCAHPARVRKLVLLAPALHRPEFANAHFEPVDVPTVLIHGSHDDIVPLDRVRELARRTFRVLDHRVVDDEHALRRTASAIDWLDLLRVA